VAVQNSDMPRIHEFNSLIISEFVATSFSSFYFLDYLFFFKIAE